MFETVFFVPQCHISENLSIRFFAFAKRIFTTIGNKNFKLLLARYLVWGFIFSRSCKIVRTLIQLLHDFLSNTKDKIN